MWTEELAALTATLDGYSVPITWVGHDVLGLRPSSLILMELGARERVRRPC